MPRVVFCYHCHRYVTPERARLHLAMLQERIEEAEREREETDDDY